MVNYIKCYQTIVHNFSDKEDLNATSSNESEKMINTKTKKEIQKMNQAQKKLLKNYTKNIGATVYMCDKFPLSFDHLIPVLEILSNVSPHINKLKNFLETESNINRNSFPLKAYIPIMLSVNAILLMKNFKFK